MTPFRSACTACSDAVSTLSAHRWEGLKFCSPRCLEPVRQAALKERHDAEDSSPVICRCAGSPRPLEPEGPHCADCRRMFSAGVRAMLRAKPRGRLVERVRALLYTELRIPVLR